MSCIKLYYTKTWKSSAMLMESSSPSNPNVAAASALHVCDSSGPKSQCTLNGVSENQNWITVTEREEHCPNPSSHVCNQFPEFGLLKGLKVRLGTTPSVNGNKGSSKTEFMHAHPGAEPRRKHCLCRRLRRVGSLVSNTLDGT